MTDLGYGRGWLNAPAAESIRRLDTELGHPLQITEAGRTWAQQKQKWDRYRRDGHPIALHPDTPSVHQLGEAIDSDEAQRHLSMMSRHGWRRTVYRNGKLVEPWHFEYFASFDQHAPKPASAALRGKLPIQHDLLREEETMPVIIKRADAPEWSLLDPDVGRDLARVEDGKTAQYRSEKTDGGVVNTYRGFIVTTDPAVAASWGRSYCRLYQSAPQTRGSADYKIAQREASRLAAEKHG